MPDKSVCLFIPRKVNYKSIIRLNTPKGTMKIVGFCWSHFIFLMLICGTTINKHLLINILSRYETLRPNNEYRKKNFEVGMYDNSKYKNNNHRPSLAYEVLRTAQHHRVPA